MTWPPSARPAGSDPFILCVIGGDPFGGALDEAARNQSVDGRRIIVRRLDSVSNAGGCHVAFVDGGASQPTGQLPILTVTDARTGSHRGIIHFSVVAGRVRFFIDEAEASERGLAISSRLLALAIGVNQR